MSKVGSHVVVDGQFVSVEHERIALALKEYEPELEVKWIPPAQRQEGDSAFAIVHNPVGSASYVLFYVPKEEDFNWSVYEKVIINDQRNGQAKLSDLEAFEAMQKAKAHQEHLDQMEEAADIAYHVLKSKKNTYKVNDSLIIKDGIPGNAAFRN